MPARAREAVMSVAVIAEGHSSLLALCVCVCVCVLLLLLSLWLMRPSASSAVSSGVRRAGACLPARAREAVMSVAVIAEGHSSLLALCVCVCVTVDQLGCEFRCEGSRCVLARARA